MNFFGSPASPTDMNHSHDKIAAVQMIFNNTTCYDLMQTSCKGIVFELAIPFELAFYALVEQETDVAPLWDPGRRCCVAIMTRSDYIRALRVCLANNISFFDLSSKTITDMLNSPIMSFQHPDFEPLEAGDSILKLCRTLIHSNADYVCVIDPENHSLIATMGYLDIIHLLDQAAKQHPILFDHSIQATSIGTFRDLATVSRQTSLAEALNLIEARNVSGVVVLDEMNKVLGFYHKADVTFITKATDPEAVLINLNSFQVGEIIQHRDPHTPSDPLSLSQSLVTCVLSDSVSSILNSMMVNRVTTVVCVDAEGRIQGVVSIQDILSYYLEESR